MILSILQDKSIQHSLNVFNNINESSMTDINNETNYSNDSTFSLKTSSTLSIPKKILRKVRPQLNLFCVYYASCLLGEVDCTKKEWIALMKVITQIIHFFKPYISITIACTSNRSYYTSKCYSTIIYSYSMVRKIL